MFAAGMVGSNDSERTNHLNSTASAGPFTALIPAGCLPDTPVIVIGGWANAQDRHVKKFADLVASYGYPSVRSILPINSIFSPIPWPRRRWAEALVAFLRHQGFLSPPRPIIFYSFSNGGAFVLEQVKRLAEKDDRGGSFALVKSNTIGFVFDSAPAYMHPGAGIQVLNTSMPEAGLLQKTFFRLELLAGEALRAMSKRPAYTRFWEEMTNLDWECPFLYLYSADDPLCDASSLDVLIENKRRLGQEVNALKWEKSGHCAHLKYHREEYVETLIKFLNECKNRKKNNDQKILSKL